MYQIKHRMGWLPAASTILILSTIASACGGTTTTKEGIAGQTTNAPLELKILAPLYNEVPDMNNAIWTAIQKSTNSKFTVEWVPASDYQNKLNLVLASGDLPDIIATTEEKYLPVVNSVKQGTFWDLGALLGDYSDYPNLKKVVVPDREKFLKIEGKLYTLPHTLGKLNTSPLIRKDWLDKLGLPMPTTMDEFAVDLKKIVESDPDGNGKKHTIGMGELNLMYASAFGIDDPTYDAAGGLIHPYLTKDFADYIAWSRDRYLDGVLPKEFSVMKTSQVQDLFKTGVIATYTNNIYHAWDFGEAIKKIQPAANVDNPILKGPKGYAVNITRGLSGGYMISKKVPEAKAKQILKLYDMTTSPEITDLINYGVEGIHYKKENNERIITDVGKKEINAELVQFLVTGENRWLKVRHPAATKQWNEAKVKEMEPVEKLGKISLISMLSSDTWTKLWPKYSDEWTTMETKAIIGDITMAQYNAYIDKLNNMPEFKKAFKEFTEIYKQMQ